MADSSLIPHILDHIVNDEIIPRLPWHTRPLLMALSRHWRNALDAIGVQGGNRLDPILGERMARATRSKQPLKCRLVLEYYHMYRNSQKHVIEPAGYLLKLFDGQWRNVAPITGRGPYTYTSVDGFLLGVVDGTLYFLQRVAGDNVRIRITALDVGGGLWQWNEVFTGEKDDYIMLHICKSGRAAGNLFVYCKCCKERDLQIREIPRWEQISDKAPNRDFRHIRSFPQPILAHVGNRLYFFGADSNYTENVSFLDLNTRGAWNSSRVAFDIRGNYNVEKNVLVVAYCGTHFDILSYDSLNKSWIRAARMSPPDDPYMRWTWCVEYDEQGEKQLCIYIFSEKPSVPFNIYQLRVVDRLRRRLLSRKAWDDIMLSCRPVKCELVDPTPVDKSFEPIEPFHNEDAPSIVIRSFHGFHRSDSIDFQDIPH